MEFISRGPTPRRLQNQLIIKNQLKQVATRSSVGVAKIMKYTRAQINKGAKQIVKKAMSFGQVAKQLSGIQGKVEVGKDKLSVHQLMVILGNHTKGNKYTADDIQLAWAAALKGDEQYAGWKTLLIVRSVPMTMIDADGSTRRLYTLTDEGYKPLRTKDLCRVVKAEDKKKDSTDVTVNANVVMQGLVQSAFINSTLKEMKKAQAKADEITKAWTNIGTSDAPVWVEVSRKDAKHAWTY